MDYSQIFTFQNFIYAIAFLFAVYELWDKGGKLIKKITDQHDKIKKWDQMEEVLMKNLQAERDKIYERYDTKLGEIEGRIEDNHTESEAKIQQTQTELFVLTQCMAAVLDGLKQLNCNGKVTEAQTLLDDYLVKRAHEQ